MIKLPNCPDFCPKNTFFLNLGRFTVVSSFLWINEEDEKLSPFGCCFQRPSAGDLLFATLRALEALGTPQLNRLMLKKAKRFAKGWMIHELKIGNRSWNLIVVWWFVIPQIFWKTVIDEVST